MAKKKKKKESPEDKLINLESQQLAAQVANWAATLDFQKERFRLLEMPQFQQGLQLDVDKFAWERATTTWEQAYKESLLTGTYQGQPTTQWLMDQAKLTGSYNGERTLEGKLTDAQIQDMHDKMKLANDEFLSSTTGYFNGQKTFDREKFEAAQAMDGWKFLATLSGPQNAFKQARAIASMPGGQSQMMDAFAGEYMLPSGAAVGSGGAASLNDMRLGWGGNAPQQPSPYAPPPAVNAPVTPPTSVPGPTYAAIPGRGFTPAQWNDATRSAVAAWNAAHPGYEADGSQVGYRAISGVTATAPPPSTMPAGYTYSPPGAQAAAGAWNYSGTASGGVSVYPPGVVSPAATADVSSNVPVSPGAVAPIVNQPYQYGGVVAPQSGGGATVAPNQLNAVNYGNAYEYQKDLLWADYEDKGYDKGLAQESFLKSLPQYSGPTKGSIAF